MIFKNISQLDESFFLVKQANKILSDARTLRIGNIVSILCPVSLDKIRSDQSINFYCEIPEISNYAGVCFQQLFLTNIANILATKYYPSNIEIVNNEIIIKKEHKHQGINQIDGVVSSTFLKRINETIIIYIGLYNFAGEKSVPRAFSLNFTEDVCKKVMDDINGNFYTLANNIFLQTSKI
jgi:hypothetical protein